MVDQHASGRRDYGAVLWSVLMFEAFLRNAEGSTATMLNQHQEPISMTRGI